MTYAIGDLVHKNEKSWRVSDFDKWGRGVGVGTVVLSPFSLDDGAVDVIWPGGRCFEELDQLEKVTSQISIDQHVSLHWTTLYREFFEYLAELRLNQDPRNSWSWFMCRHYSQEFVESSRVSIVKMGNEKTNNDGAEFKLSSIDISTINYILKEYEKAKTSQQ